MKLSEQVAAWAVAKTDASSRRYDDLIRDKTNALLGTTENAKVAGFFTFCKRAAAAVTAEDVVAWTAALQEAGLSQSTVYARVSRVSSFYDWLRLHGELTDNPVQAARPAAPSAYATDRARPLTAANVDTLLATVRERANSDSPFAISSKRDYALLQFYFATGKKRGEVIALRWSDISLTADGVRVLTNTPPTEVPGVRAALVAYLKASGRWDAAAGEPKLAPNAPLWLRHDRAARGREAITSHGFVFMLKQYALAAGLGDIQLNQTRDTAALRASEELETLAEVQARLGYQSRSMTRAYLRRLKDGPGGSAGTN